MAAIVAITLLAPFGLQLATPSSALAASCAEDANNLLRNGTMAGGDPQALGVVAQKWKPFVVGATVPVFENADNEGYDPNGSQYIWRDFGAWDAGIFQKRKNLTPGQTYHFWMVWGQALHDIAGNNARATQMNRQLGVDLTGGKDPTSPNVVWTVPYYGESGFNRSEWNLYFTATGSQATFFLRAQNGHTDGRNKVFFDTACLYPASGEPTSTPWSPTATATFTATPVPERIEDTAAGISYSEGWQETADANASGGGYHVARGVKGAAVSAKYSFTGSQLTIWYVADSNRGKAGVMVDGVKVGVINQYAPETTYNLSRTFQLIPGEHQVKLKNKGAKDANATDTYISLDALAVSDSTALLQGHKNASARVTVTPAVGKPRATATPARRVRLKPFKLANPAAPTPDDPSVIWDPRLPGLNVYLQPANVAQGTLYWKLIRADYQDGFESGGNHNMYYIVTDQQGNRVANQTVWQSWPDDATSTQTRQDGTADIAIWANYWPQNGPGPYNGYVGGLPSDEVRGMGLPGNNHVNFILYFQKAIKNNNDGPTNTPTATLSPTATFTPSLTPSPTMTNTPAASLIVDDTDGRISYKGAWLVGNPPEAFAGTLHVGRGIKKGARVGVSYNFTGNEITLRFGSAPNNGKAKVIIDGVKLGMLDLYSADTLFNRTHTFGNLGFGAHTIKLKNRGQKNSASSDTFISVDAFESR